MTYGLRVTDIKGRKVIDENYSLSSYLYNELVAADSDSSKELTDLANRKYSVFVYKQATSQLNYLKQAHHTVSKSGNTLSFTHQHSTDGGIVITSSATLFIVFLR